MNKLNKVRRAKLLAKLSTVIAIVTLVASGIGALIFIFNQNFTFKLTVTCFLGVLAVVYFGILILNHFLKFDKVIKMTTRKGIRKVRLSKLEQTSMLAVSLSDSTEIWFKPKNKKTIVYFLNLADNTGQMTPMKDEKALTLYNKIKQNEFSEEQLVNLSAAISEL